ncbi:unnamed protein product [Brassica oleracea var. botrytis]
MILHKITFSYAFHQASCVHPTNQELSAINPTTIKPNQLPLT